jgi:PhoH-like ATPase
MENTPGLREVRVRPELINKLYSEKFLDAAIDTREFDKRLKFHENEYLSILDLHGSSQSAIGRAEGDKITLVKTDLAANGVKARNREQHAALHALLDDKIRVVILTGRAGTGKTLLTLAAAIDKVQSRDTSFERIILTRPMSWVGKHGLGALPGDVDEKFGPYLENYMTNLEYMIDGGRETISHMVEQLDMEFIPLQLIRGASWAKSFIIADEVQVLDYSEMVALGTRVGEGSKIVIMGDLGQRDENIAREKTGIYKLVHHELALQSPLVSVIDLVKVERGPVAELFADIFGV